MARRGYDVLVIVGNTYSFDYENGTLSGTIKVDPPETVDLIIKEGLDKGGTLPGLFELTGDTLKLAIPSPLLVRDGKTTDRPTALQPGPQTRHMLYTFVRDKTATKEQAKAKLKEMKDKAAAQTKEPY